MGIAEIIGIIVTTGINVIPRIVAFIEELNAMNGQPPTQEQIDGLWARHRAAYDRAMAVDPNTKPE